MAYQRAQWHSGLTYTQICENCKSKVEYTDYSLGFRPWYADGYVDCPRCGTHLRHNEKYAENAPAPAVVETPVEPVQEVAAPAEPVQETAAGPVFCTACGNKFREGDRFCAMCGAKRA